MKTNILLFALAAICLIVAFFRTLRGYDQPKTESKAATLVDSTSVNDTADAFQPGYRIGYVIRGLNDIIGKDPVKYLAEREAEWASIKAKCATPKTEKKP